MSWLPHFSPSPESGTIKLLEGNMKFNEKLLEIIVCPECKTDLKLTEDKTGLKCDSCKRIYPIDENGIPHLLLEEATVEE